MYNEDIRLEIDNFYLSIKEAKEAIKILQDHCVHDKTISKRTHKICVHCDSIIKTKRKHNYA